MPDILRLLSDGEDLIRQWRRWGEDISRVNVLRKTVSIYSWVGGDSVGVGVVGIPARKGWWWKGSLAWLALLWLINPVGESWQPALKFRGFMSASWFH